MPIARPKSRTAPPRPERPAAPTRARMVAGAVDLVRRRGTAATSLRDVIEHTATPRGSLGHHFPRGKAELLEAVLEMARDHISGRLSSALDEHGPRGGLRQFTQYWRRSLQEADFEAGCAVLPFAIESWGDDERREGRTRDGTNLRQQAQGAFDEWTALLAASLQDAGVPQTRAQSLATLTVAALEGAIAMCRLSRTLQPLEHVSAELDRTLGEALEARRS